MVKPENVGEGDLHRWGTAEDRQIADWLKSLNLPKGQDVEGGWNVIQRSLEDAGAPVRYPLPTRRRAARPSRPPPPEPPRAPEPVPPTGPGSPPRPPGAPPAGGGGPGAGGPPGVRPLTPDEAEHLAGSEAILSSRPDYDHTVIVDRDTYRAAWRTAAGPQGGEPPPHGYWMTTGARSSSTDRGSTQRRSPHAPDAAIRAGRARPARGRLPGRRRQRTQPARSGAGRPRPARRSHHRCSHGRRRLRQTSPPGPGIPRTRTAGSNAVQRADRDHYFAARILQGGRRHARGRAEPGGALLRRSPFRGWHHRDGLRAAKG